MEMDYDLKKMASFHAFVYFREVAKNIKIAVTVKLQVCNNIRVGAYTFRGRLTFVKTFSLHCMLKTLSQDKPTLNY